MTPRPALPDDVTQRMRNVAEDFHLNLDTMPDAHFLALARECGWGDGR